jgi:hypothetical protein
MSTIIDNFFQIANLLKFENEGDFYFVQVLQRKKDHKGERVGGSNNSSRLIKAYYVHSLDSLANYREEIIKLCEVFGARAYINLNRRNAKDVALELLAEIAHNIKSGHNNYLYRAYSTVCGRHHSDKDKTWVVDIDFDKPIINSRKLMLTLAELEPTGNKVIAQIPTKNGVHLITKPFNSQKFSQEFPDIDVHKNNPTVLFIPQIN